MKRLKVLENKKLRIIEELEDGTPVTKNVYKGYLIGDIPNEYTAWFNYKGLTYILY
jgi:uncharacterized protein (DUF3820 family)